MDVKHRVDVKPPLSPFTSSHSPTVLVFCWFKCRLLCFWAGMWKKFVIFMQVYIYIICKIVNLQKITISLIQFSKHCIPSLAQYILKIHAEAHCYKIIMQQKGSRSSGTVWESRWPSWAFHPNEPYGFCGRKATLNHAQALVTICPYYASRHPRTWSRTSSSSKGASWGCLFAGLSADAGSFVTHCSDRPDVHSWWQVLVSFWW